MTLPEVEEDALRLLQHGVVGGFDGCEEGWDVGGFDGHLHVENEGEGLDFFEGWWGRHFCCCSSVWEVMVWEVGFREGSCWYYYIV